jgi:predicted methyltransferase
MIENSLDGCNILHRMASRPEKFNRRRSDNLPELVLKQHKRLFNVSGDAAPKLDTIRIGFIGLDNRGTGCVSKISLLERVGIIVVCSVAMLLGGGIGCAAQDQGNRPEGTHQDNTEGKEWIRRLERPDRIPGLKTNEVVRFLQLRPGDVVADIGAGTGVYTIPFAKAVAPIGRALGIDIHQDLLDYIDAKAKVENVTNLQTILAKLDDPNLPKGQVDVAFFNDVFHNTNDRAEYLKVLASYLKPTGRIVIIEQEYDDPIAKKWDRPEDRITREQVQAWMALVGFHLIAESDIFQGANNPKGTGMPERWFVVYSREKASTR